PRVYVRDGKLLRGWIQDATGVTLEQGLMELAEKRFGKGNFDNVSRLVKSDPRLYRQIEQAFLERFILGDTDFHSKNMKLLPDGRVQNFDLDLAMHTNSRPEVTSSPSYGVNDRLLKDLALAPISPESMSKLRSFELRFDNDLGRAKLQSFGYSRS